MHHESPVDGSEITGVYRCQLTGIFCFQIALNDPGTVQRQSTTEVLPNDDVSGESFAA